MWMGSILDRWQAPCGFFAVSTFSWPNSQGRGESTRRQHGLAGPCSSNRCAIPFGVHRSPTASANVPCLLCRHAFPNEVDAARGLNTVHVSYLNAHVLLYNQAVTFVTDSADVAIDNIVAALDLRMNCYEGWWSKKTLVLAQMINMYSCT